MGSRREEQLLKIIRDKDLQLEMYLHAIRAAQHNGQLQIYISDLVPENQIITIPGGYTQQQVDTMTNGFRHEALARYDALNAFHDMDKLISGIDLVMTVAPVGERVSLLKGHDERLGGLYTGVIGKARLININVAERFPDLHSGVIERIEGLQRLPKDDGDYLLKAIARHSTENMQKLAEDALKKIRQGRTVEPETERLHQYALQFRITIRPLPSWKDAALNILNSLIQRENTDPKFDDVDKNILATLRQQRSLSERKLSDYVRDAYYRYEKIVAKWAA